MTITEERPSTGSSGPPPQGAGTAASKGFFYLVFPLMMALLIVALLGLVLVAFIAVFNDDSGGGSAGSDGAVSNLEVSLAEFSITGELSAPAGDVTLNVVNAGSIEHNLVVRELDVQTRSLMSRGVDTLQLGNLDAGTYELYCSIAGHEASGMVAELNIAAPGEALSASADPHEGLSPAEMDQLMVDSMLAFPAETEGKGNPILEPEILSDGTKKFTLVAEVTPWEVSPGEFVDAWTYNGVVPGPQIIVDVGDKVQVELTNLTPMGTDIHWHGIHTPNFQDGVSPYTQDPVSSGETFTYEFVAEDPAIGMYHAHLHSQVSVINGMFAAFIIGENPIPYGTTVSGMEIPSEADLDIAFEEPMVLNDAGVIGLTLNGKSFPATEPLVMENGQWGIIHYYNEA